MYRRLDRTVLAASLVLAIAGCSVAATASDPSSPTATVLVTPAPTTTPTARPLPSPLVPPGETEPPFPTTAYPPAEFWEMAAPGGENVEHYTALASMTRAADAVVIGTATSI